MTTWQNSLQRRLTSDSVLDDLEHIASTAQNHVERYIETQDISHAYALMDHAYMYLSAVQDHQQDLGLEKAQMTWGLAGQDVSAIAKHLDILDEQLDRMFSMSTGYRQFNAVDDTSWEHNPHWERKENFNAYFRQANKKVENALLYTPITEKCLADTGRENLLMAIKLLRKAHMAMYT